MAVERVEEKKGLEEDAARLRRLREDAKRPMSVNLAEGIALSRMLGQFVGVAAGS